MHADKPNGMPLLLLAFIALVLAAPVVYVIHAVTDDATRSCGGG